MTGHPRLWINVHQAAEPALRLAASLGVGWVRVDGNLYDLTDGPDHYTFEWLDALVATCTTLGLQPYVTLSYSAPWMGTPRGEAPPLGDWQVFCTAFARHFRGRLTSVGCWNEYQGSGQAYVSRLLRPMAECFRAVDDRYRIGGPDIATEGNWPVRLHDVLQYGADCLDIVTVHVYADTGQAVWDKLTKPPRWWEVWKSPSIKQVIQRAGWYGPVWVTESGWQSATVGDIKQADYLDQLLERLAGADWPSGLFVYQLMDEPTNTWGLFDVDGTMKPAGRVLQAWASGGSRRDVILAAYHDYQPAPEDPR